MSEGMEGIHNRRRRERWMVEGQEAVVEVQECGEYYGYLVMMRRKRRGASSRPRRRGFLRALLVWSARRGRINETAMHTVCLSKPAGNRLTASGIAGQLFSSSIDRPFNLWTKRVSGWATIVHF